MTPDALARACADAMWRDDHACQALNIRITHITAGHASLQLDITKSMTNGHGICHGGFIFTLADSAFAYACNGYGQRVVAQQASITFLNPAAQGDTLTATAREISRQGRSGIYDIAVTNQTGTRIAEFRGHSRSISGTHLPTESEA